tara:strand:- start:27 stop:239 length:213 start_codon:yes stop_codon:yes gene_type:complete
MTDESMHSKYLELSAKAAEGVKENLEIYHNAQDFVDKAEAHRYRAYEGLVQAQDLYEDLQMKLKSLEENN